MKTSSSEDDLFKIMGTGAGDRFAQGSWLQVKHRDYDSFFQGAEPFDQGGLHIRRSLFRGDDPDLDQIQFFRLF